jgi:hypothetical protein
MRLNAPAAESPSAKLEIEVARFIIAEPKLIPARRA